MRTNDIHYGEDYWDSYDNGLGYSDGPLWEDLAHIIKEWWGYEDEKDVSLKTNLLDIGCASGFLVKHLRRRGFDAWGVDISDYAMKQVDGLYKKYIRVWDVTSNFPPQFDWHSFDRIICLETLEHVNEPQHALENIKSMLKKDGEAFLAICVEENENWESDPTHISIFPHWWWREEIAKLGFVRDYEAENFFRRFSFWRDHNGIFVVKNVDEPSKELAYPPELSIFNLTNGEESGLMQTAGAEGQGCVPGVRVPPLVSD